MHCVIESVVGSRGCNRVLWSVQVKALPTCLLLLPSCLFAGNVEVVIYECGYVMC